MLQTIWFTLPLISLGCFPYVYHSQDRVLIPGVDIPATLEIAEIKLEGGGFDATLTLWAIRDQIVTAGEARRIAALYSAYIDRVAAEKDQVTADFGVWHFTWAIANLYRNGDSSVRRELEPSYLDAKQRPATLEHFEGIARDHVNGTTIVMGDIHWPARAFARAHIVAPGNEGFLQSLDEYRKTRTRR
jgi:hypothetical protein